MPRRERLLSELKSFGYQIPSSEATFFLYPKICGANEWEFVETLAENGVLVLPAAMFHHAGHFRLSITASDQMVEESLSVFKEVAMKSHG